MHDYPSIGVGIVVTNPISSGYYAFLAATEVATRIADEIVIVDGGSTDGSIDILREWVGEDRKLKYISSSLTHWGKGDDWSWPQICVNLNTALENLTTDWGFVYSADYVMDVRTSSRFFDELQQNSNCYWVRTRRGKPDNGKVTHNLDQRNVIFNLGKARANGIKIGFGIDKSSGGFSDFPIVFEEYAYFMDPVNNMRKPVYRGSPLACGGVLSTEFLAYGHFFYNMQQVEHKIKRWEKATSRFLGLASARLAELKIRHRVHSIKGFYSKPEVESWDHPNEIKRVIQAHYSDGMIGGAIRKETWIKNTVLNGLLLLLKIDRRARTILLKCLGRKGEQADLSWEKMPDLKS